MMDKRVNIPNVLSVMRILTMPLIVYFIVHSTPHNFPVLILVFIFSILLDFFDGYLARKLSQETPLGQILDPLADKLMITCIVVALIIKTDFPVWLGLLIIGRDLVIIVASAIMFKGKQIVNPSILVGKTTFALLGALIMVYILDLPGYVHMDILKRFFIVLTVSFLGWSWIEYYQIYKRENHAQQH